MDARAKSCALPIGFRSALFFIQQSIYRCCVFAVFRSEGLMAICIMLIVVLAALFTPVVSIVFCSLCVHVTTACTAAAAAVLTAAAAVLTACCMQQKKKLTNS